MSYELPETLDGLTVAEIDAQIDQALEAFHALKITEDSSDEEITAGESIVESINALRAAKTEAQEAAAKKAAKVAGLNEQTQIAADEPDDKITESPETPDAEAETPETAPEPVAEVPAEDVTDAPQEAEAVAASADQTTPSSVARAAANAPEVVVPTAQTASLTAAADVPGFSNGQELDGLRGVAKAVTTRMKGLPRTNLATAAGGVRQRYGAAVIQKTNFDEDLVQKSDGGSDMDLVWAAGNQDRLPGGSLVAAGGWCAPSETLYDLCQYETVEGILSVPEMNITRGGIRYTPGPDFSDIYDACGFEQTEAEAQAGDCKDCCTVDCPEFDEIRLDAIGLCVKSPILTEHAYPELVQRFIEGALVAHQHKVNAYILEAMLMAAGTPQVAADAGSFSKTLAQIEYVAVAMRYRYRLSQTADLEIVLPFWAKTQLRIDLGMENDRDGEVSDAEIAAWFSARNLSPQWVYDFQDLTLEDGLNEAVMPEEVTVLLYPAGTWTKGTADVINVDAVYDSPNLEANQYTALFVEEGILAVQRCLSTAAVTLPICVSGKGVLDDIDTCLVAPATPEPAT